MKHVVTRPFVMSTATRLKAAYARQPLHQPAKFPLICVFILMLLTILMANGGGPLFVAGAIGIVICVIWLIWRCAKRVTAFVIDFGGSEACVCPKK